MTAPASSSPTGKPPTLVALIRGAILAAIIAGVAALAAALPGVDLAAIPPEWRPVAALGVLVAVRTLEGLVDHLRGQAPQAGLLGGAPADPLRYVKGTGDLTATDVARLAELPGYALEEELTRRRTITAPMDPTLTAALARRRRRPRR